MARYTDRGTFDSDNFEREHERLLNDQHDMDALNLVRACNAVQTHDPNKRARVETPADEPTTLQYIGGVIALTVLFLLIIIIPGLF